MAEAPQRVGMTVPRLCQNLRELALSMGPAQKLPTVNELCSQFGTSRATLDEALSKLEQQHVIYRKHSKGIFVSDKIHRKTICVLLDASLLAQQSHSPFWGELWHLFAQEAQQRTQAKNEYHSFHLVLRTEEQKAVLPEEVVNMLQTERIHGLLVIGMSDYEWIERGTIPCVTFAGYDRWMVTFDFTQFALMAVKNLVDQGCQNIGMWSPTIITVDGPQPPTFDDFRYFLTVLDRPFNPELTHTVSLDIVKKRTRGISLPEQGYLIAMDVFGNPDRLKPDGLVIPDDMVMEGVLAAFNQLNVKIGEDIKVATHANVGSLLMLNYMSGLTVIEFDPAELVQKMFMILDLLMSGKQPAEALTKIAPKIRQAVNLLDEINC